MKIAIVTGAAQGVGLATSRLLTQSGYHVLMTDIQPLDEQAALLASEGGQISTISGDVSDEGFANEIAAKIASEHGVADLLVNNAGISLIAPAEDTSLDQWQRVMAINLAGPFLLSRAIGTQMLQRGRGSIVNVASIAGLRGG